MRIDNCLNTGFGSSLIILAAETCAFRKIYDLYRIKDTQVFFISNLQFRSWTLKSNNSFQCPEHQLNWLEFKEGCECYYTQPWMHFNDFIIMSELMPYFHTKNFSSTLPYNIFSVMAYVYHLIITHEQQNCMNDSS